MAGRRPDTAAPLRALVAAGAALAALAGPAAALSVGSYDDSRLAFPASFNLDGGTSTASLRADLDAAGHDILTTNLPDATFLAGVDMLFTSLLNDTFAFQPGEEAAIFDWVRDGGTLFWLGENAAWQATTDLYLAQAGLSHGGDSASGGTFATGSGPLLANGVAGGAIGTSVPGTIAGADSALGASDGGPIAFSTAVGSGVVVGLMDSLALQSTASRRFILNALENAPAVAASPPPDDGGSPEDPAAIVPLPAGAPLLAAALGLLAVLRRRAG